MSIIKNIYEKYNEMKQIDKTQPKEKNVGREESSIYLPNLIIFKV